MKIFFIGITLKIIILLIIVLLSVSFFTLMEQKVLGGLQKRSAPLETGLLGLLQPISDAGKLFKGELIFRFYFNYFLYFFSPFFILFVSLVSWFVFPLISGSLSFSNTMLFYFCCLGVGVYGPLFSGWFSNSKYSLLGSVRVVAQVLSYEVRFYFCLIRVCFLTCSYKFVIFSEFQYIRWFLFLVFPLALLWLILSFAETSRTPFDLYEGESELVSGFNTEYGGGVFALIFISEYAIILLISLLFILFFGGGANFFAGFLLLTYVFILVRGVFPRIRYDQLIYSAWTLFLCWAIIIFIIIFSFVFVLETLL